jgi:hypothetical protein
MLACELRIVVDKWSGLLVRRRPRPREKSKGFGIPEAITARRERRRESAAGNRGSTRQPQE